MISTPGSLSFAKLVVMSSAPAKSSGDPRYASQDPIIQSTLSHTISTPICIRSEFFLRRTQNSETEGRIKGLMGFLLGNSWHGQGTVFQRFSRKGIVKELEVV